MFVLPTSLRFSYINFLLKQRLITRTFNFYIESETRKLPLKIVKVEGKASAVFDKFDMQIQVAGGTKQDCETRVKVK